MPPSTTEYPFAAPVLRMQEGLKQHYIPVPDEVADALQAAGVRRVVATLNGHNVRRAIQHRQGCERYLMLGRAVLREVGARYGDTVTVVLRPDPEPDTIDLGEEFAAVLEQDADAATRFEQLTPGRQRSLAYYVTSAKSIETRIKRALELAHKLKTHTLYGDRRQGR